MTYLELIEALQELIQKYPHLATKSVSVYQTNHVVSEVHHVQGPTGGDCICTRRKES
jgi:hypothetical protein